MHHPYPVHPTGAQAQGPVWTGRPAQPRGVLRSKIRPADDRSTDEDFAPNTIRRVVAKVRGRVVAEGPLTGELGVELGKLAQVHGRRLVITLKSKIKLGKGLGFRKFRYRGNGRRKL